MSKAALALVGLAVVGGGLYMASKAHAESDPGAAPPGNDEFPLQTVTGNSGTTYQVQMVDAFEGTGGEGRRIVFDVFDVSGQILRYIQYQGDDNSRIIVPTPDAPHAVGDPMWLNAVQDFGILTGV